MTAGDGANETGMLSSRNDGTAMGSGNADAGVTSDAGGEEPVVCIATPNTGSTTDGDINIDFDVEFQSIAGFGGISMPTWIADMTPGQVDSAFGNEDGQLGLSILRVRVPHDDTEFPLELPTAIRAVELDATVFASPWTPPAEMKSNNNIVGGELNEDSYTVYADHLLSFRNFMESNGVPIEAISVQNDPDIAVDYESCDWTPQQMGTGCVSRALGLETPS